MVFWIIVALIIGIIIYKKLKLYRLDTKDTVIAFSGGLGSGKTFLSVDVGKGAYSWAKVGYFFDKIFHRKKMKDVPPPQLYSSIPIMIKKGKKNKPPVYSLKLTPEILLLQERINPRSVVVIDELSSFLNQFEYKAVNADRLDEFVRLFRHYTLGGKLIVNDQCSENIVLQIRRRLNVVYNLMRWRKVPILPIYHVRVRNISISEEIKTVLTEDHVEDQTGLVLGWVPHFRRYDTYCYSRRYERLPYCQPTEYDELKKDELLKNVPYQMPNKIDFAIKLEKEIRSAIDIIDEDNKKCPKNSKT